jgi:hypothetical protein
MSGKDDLKPAAHFSFTKEKRFERRQIITTTTLQQALHLLHCNHSRLL